MLTFGKPIIIEKICLLWGRRPLKMGNSIWYTLMLLLPQCQDWHCGNNSKIIKKNAIL